MSNRLIDYFKRISPLSAEEVAAIEKSMVVKTFPKNHLLLKEGQISAECYFVLKGCVRQYYLVDGDERTSEFFTEEQWVVSFNSFTQKIPADHFLSCSEECELVIGTEERENDLYKNFPKLETISRLVIGQVFGDQQELRAGFVTENPEQRYLRLLRTRPDLLQRVPQYQLASYVGVTPEALSRIKKRLAG